MCCAALEMVDVRATAMLRLLRSGSASTSMASRGGAGAGTDGRKSGERGHRR